MFDRKMADNNMNLKESSTSIANEYEYGLNVSIIADITSFKSV